MQEIIAHRGASAHAPEHTLAAYDLALQQGADMLELDVRATAAGELVIVHDTTLLRTAGNPTRVEDVPCAADAGLLTLEAVLARYGAVTRFLVELKDPEPEWEGRVLVALGRARLHDRVVVQSFDHTALRRLHDAAPGLSLAALFGEGATLPRDLGGVATFASGIAPWHHDVGPDLVAEARAHGLAVRPWTANAPRDIDRLLGLGVEGVITDVPGVATALRPWQPLAAA